MTIAHLRFYGRALVIVALTLPVFLTACAPRQTRPDGTYPKTPGRRPLVLPNVPLSQMRCFGGGIGGCSLGGRAQ
jgi:hypothetical protein